MRVRNLIFGEEDAQGPTSYRWIKHNKSVKYYIFGDDGLLKKAYAVFNTFCII